MNLSTVRGALHKIGDWIQTYRGGRAAYRKCPNCGEPTFRISDRQLTRPDVYGSRTFRIKWFCLNCDYRTIEDIEEPD
jgi:C4-type Zn-finger protein